MWCGGLFRHAGTRLLNQYVCTVVIIVVFNYVCECTVGIDVGDALMLAMR